MHCTSRMVDAKQVKSQVDCKGLGVEKVRLDDVRDRGPNRWTGTDTGRVQRNAHDKWFDITEAAMLNRQDNALQGKTAYNGNVMA
eukprot:5656801-Pyramimonas_sp.AAC.1